jgi:hypothetical protein
LMQQMHSNLVALLPGADDVASSAPGKVRTRVRPQAKTSARPNLVAAKP